ncbi:putative arginine--tRNA ligase, mitochondrial [Hypsibius exemplaris]|uniref:Probable arginine--tRNA ligase, mitochondrial n=1 Tax=Hypsibius exemplaris TaxID=2072580 RepID=A0A1W0WWX4_HYPEX|nr:putative arginine--tRNA ligase, mitochondrial [Hypsibius exemplaris]
MKVSIFYQPSRSVYRNVRKFSIESLSGAPLISNATKKPAEVLRAILEQKEDYPFASIRPSVSRTVVLDYSSPNIAKPFHAGHLRSTMLGNFVGNISAAMGHRVHRINYLGDWGTQCGVVLAAMEAFGSESELQKHPLRHLLDVYVKGSQLFETDVSFKARVEQMMNSLENGDAKLLNTWMDIRRLSVQEYRIIPTGESQYVAGARDAVNRLAELNASKHPRNDEVSAVEKRLLKSDGGSLYLSRDLAAVIDRANRLNFDDMLYIVDNAQHDHFRSVIELASNFEELKGRNLRHIKFGRIRGLSTRKGQVVLLSDLLDEADQTMKVRIKRSKYARPKPEELDSVAHTLALSVIIVNDFRQHRHNDYENAAITLQQSEGDSGVFLQYVHARLRSLEENSGVILNADADFSTVVEPEALELVEHLQLASSIAKKSFEQYEPVYLVNYLFRNGHLVNKVLKTLRVKNQPASIGEPRLALLHCARLVARSFMKVLGLQPLDAM